MNIHSTYDFEETATHLIYRVGRLIRYQAAAFFKRNSMEITPEQWGMLLKIAKTEGITLGKLTDRTFNDYPNVTRLADGLEKMEFIERSRNPKDRRSFIVRATLKGKGFIDSTLPQLLETKAEMYEGLNERDILHLNTILKKMETNIETMELPCCPQSPAP